MLRKYGLFPSILSDGTFSCVVKITQSMGEQVLPSKDTNKWLDVSEPKLTTNFMFYQSGDRFLWDTNFVIDRNSAALSSTSKQTYPEIRDPDLTKDRCIYFAAPLPRMQFSPVVDSVRVTTLSSYAEYGSSRNFIHSALPVLCH